MSTASRRTSFSVLAFAAASALIAQPVSALEYNFGDVQVFLDTTVSAGVSVRVADTNPLFLPEGNGGPLDQRALLGLGAGGTVANPSAAANTPGSLFVSDSGSDNDNFGGSVNGDDGRLNFDSGDLTSGVVKVTNDIQANWQNFTAFARLSSFYDAVLDQDSAYERSSIDSGAKVDAARDIDLLDLYVSGDFDVGNLPLNVRLGKQVVSWGESTFILNGINSWNPVDVNAFRRPGAEIKEGLLPVWGAYASIGLPYDLSLEAFYQFEFQEVQLDRAGTPFASSDIAKIGSEFGGNVGGVSFTSGSQRSGSFKRNCTTTAGVSLDGIFGPGFNPGCAQGDGSFIDFRDDIPIGINEQVRLANNDLTALERGVDREADDTGQYGLALRWYAEELNSTEFGFYFMNYHSRLPLVSQRTLNPVVNVGVIGASSSAVTRATLAAGCAAFGATGSFADPRLGGPTAPGGFGILGTAGNGFDDIQDPNGLVAGIRAATGGAGFSAPTGTILELAQANCVLLGAAAGANTISATDVGTANPLTGGTTFQPGLATTPDGEINIADAIASLGFSPTLEGAFPTGAGANGVIDDVPLLVTGAEFLQLANRSAGFLEYPEDIQLFGVSFNTTVGDWGVQGEVAFRRDQPLQLDTDATTIAAAAANCAFPAGGDVTGGSFEPLVTSNIFCGTGALVGQEITGFVREEVVTFDLGTTATYTNSNELVGFLGADLGILLTEVGALYLPDAGDEGDFSKQPLGNVCTSGSDLPLGGLLALDARSGCRPTKFSYGYVLVGQLQYNNAFGTPITLTPQVAWSHDVKGNSPAPLSNYREGSKSLSLALNGTYQSSWRGGISYVNNFGNEKFSNDGDTDFVSVNISYSF